MHNVYTVARSHSHKHARPPQQGNSRSSFIPAVHSIYKNLLPDPDFLGPWCLSQNPTPQLEKTGWKDVTPLWLLRIFTLPVVSIQSQTSQVYQHCTPCRAEGALAERSERTVCLHTHHCVFTQLHPRPHEDSCLQRKESEHQGVKNRSERKLRLGEHIWRVSTPHFVPEEGLGHQDPSACWGRALGRINRWRWLTYGCLPASSPVQPSYSAHTHSGAAPLSMWLCRFRSVSSSWGSLKLSDFKFTQPLPDGPSLSLTHGAADWGAPHASSRQALGPRILTRGWQTIPSHLPFHTPWEGRRPSQAQVCCLWQGWPGTHIEPRLFCGDPHAGLQLEALLHHSPPPSQSRHPLLPYLSRGLGMLLRTSGSYHTATVDDNRERCIFSLDEFFHQSCLPHFLLRHHSLKILTRLTCVVSSPAPKPALEGHCWEKWWPLGTQRKGHGENWWAQRVRCISRNTAMLSDPLERGLGSQVSAHLAQVGRKEPPLQSWLGNRGPAGR